MLKTFNLLVSERLTKNEKKGEKKNEKKKNEKKSTKERTYAVFKTSKTTDILHY